MSLSAALLAFLLVQSQSAGASTPPDTAPQPAPAAIEMMRAGADEGAEFDAAAARLRDAAEAGAPAAMRWMGVLAGARGDRDAAERWLEQALEAAESGDDAAERARAAYALAAHYSGDPQTAPQSRALLESLDNPPGDIAAQAAGYLGADYLFGLGGPADPATGQAYLNSAITLGFQDPAILEAYAMTVMASDRSRATTLLRRAADAGSPGAAWRFAMIWLEDQRNPVIAYDYVVQAADQGYLNAQISHAVMLATGQGVAQDLDAARAAYLDAARRGSAHGVRGLGVMMLAGEGGPVQAATGYALLELAAEAGDAGAASLLETRPETFAVRPGEADIAAARQTWLTEHGLSAQVFE